MNGLRRMRARAPFKKRAYYLRNPSLVVLAFPFSSLPLPRARALSRYTYTLPRSSFHPLFRTPLSVWRPQPRLLSSFLSAFLLSVRSSLLLRFLLSYSCFRVCTRKSTVYTRSILLFLSHGHRRRRRRRRRGGGKQAGYASAYAARYYVMPADRRSDILCMLMPHNVGFVPLFSIYLFGPPPSALLSRAYVAPRDVFVRRACARVPLSGRTCVSRSRSSNNSAGRFADIPPGRRQKITIRGQNEEKVFFIIIIITLLTGDASL